MNTVDRSRFTVAHSSGWLATLPTTWDGNRSVGQSPGPTLRQYFSILLGRAPANFKEDSSRWSILTGAFTPAHDQTAGPRGSTNEAL